MPLFEIPLTITSLEDQPSVGSVITDIDVADFINACSDEEFEDLVQRIRVIALENQNVAAPPGLRPMSEEEIEALGLPPIPTLPLDNEIVKDVELPPMEVKRRKPKRRTKK